MDHQSAPLKQQNVDTFGRDQHISARAFQPVQDFSFVPVVTAQGIYEGLHNICKKTLKKTIINISWKCPPPLKPKRWTHGRKALKDKMAYYLACFSIKSISQHHELFQLWTGKIDAKQANCWELKGCTHNYQDWHPEAADKHPLPHWHSSTANKEMLYVPEFLVCQPIQAHKIRLGLQPQSPSSHTTMSNKRFTLDEVADYKWEQDAIQFWILSWKARPVPYEDLLLPQAMLPAPPKSTRKAYVGH